MSDGVGVMRRVMIAPIRAYQHVAGGRPSPCRFDPSCSQYAIEAISVHGAFKGGWLATKRIGRCHPWGGFGWYPVPAKGRAGGSNQEQSDTTKESEIQTSTSEPALGSQKSPNQSKRERSA